MRSLMFHPLFEHSRDSSPNCTRCSALDVLHDNTVAAFDTVDNFFASSIDVCGFLELLSWHVKEHHVLASCCNESSMLQSLWLRLVISHDSNGNIAL